MYLLVWQFENAGNDGALTAVSFILYQEVYAATQRTLNTLATGQLTGVGEESGHMRVALSSGTNLNGKAKFKSHAHGLNLVINTLTQKVLDGEDARIAYVLLSTHVNLTGGDHFLLVNESSLTDERLGHLDEGRRDALVKIAGHTKKAPIYAPAYASSNQSQVTWGQMQLHQLHYWLDRVLTRDGTRTMTLAREEAGQIQIAAFDGASLVGTSGQIAQAKETDNGSAAALSDALSDAAILMLDLGGLDRVLLLDSITKGDISWLSPLLNRLNPAMRDEVTEEDIERGLSSSAPCLRVNTSGSIIPEPDEIDLWRLTVSAEECLVWRFLDKLQNN